MDKKALRREVAARIAAMTDEQKKEESEKVKQKIADLGIKGKKVFIYNALPDEVDTAGIIYALAEENEVFLPVVDGENMFLAKYDGTAEKGAYGIYEPAGQRFRAEEVNPDICITPPRAFDKDLNRLGRGKGYYDRFFAATDCVKIALAFNCQQVSGIPSDEHDIKTDAVITANGKYGK